MSFPSINLSSCNDSYYNDIHYDKLPWQFSPLPEQEEPLLEEHLFGCLTPPRDNFIDDENEKKKRLTSAVPLTVNQPAASSVALSILSSFNLENHYPRGENDGESSVGPNSSPKTHLDAVNSLELTVGAKITSRKRKPILSEKSIELTQNELENKRNRSKQNSAKYRNKVKMKEQELIKENEELNCKVDKLNREIQILKYQLESSSNLVQENKMLKDQLLI